jgi:hypothetical protein
MHFTPKKYQKKSSNISWGIIVLTRNKYKIHAIWSFDNNDQRKKYLKEANNCVLNNINRNITHQVSLHYGLKPMDIT